MRIFENDPRFGFPIGTYDVLYYTLRNGELSLDKGCDSNVSEVHVAGIYPAANEIATAICTSHPHRPVMRIYGSFAVREADIRGG